MKTEPIQQKMVGHVDPNGRVIVESHQGMAKCGPLQREWSTEPNVGELKKRRLRIRMVTDVPSGDEVLQEPGYLRGLGDTSNGSLGPFEEAGEQPRYALEDDLERLHQELRREGTVEPETFTRVIDRRIRCARMPQPNAQFCLGEPRHGWLRTTPASPFQ